MKVERKDVSFIPVTITLESQFEVDVLCELAARVTGCGDVREVADSLYYQLTAHNSNGDSSANEQYFAGVLIASEDF